MKKLLAVLFVMFLLTGCASTGAVDSLSNRFNENNKRIDKNFVIIKNVLDAQAKAITELQPKKEPISGAEVVHTPEVKPN